MWIFYLVLVYSILIFIIPGIIIWKNNLYYVIVRREKANLEKAKQTSMFAGLFLILNGTLFPLSVYFSNI